MSAKTKSEFEMGDTIYIITKKREVMPLSIEKVEVKKGEVLYSTKGGSTYPRQTFSADEFGPFATEKEACVALADMTHSDDQIAEWQESDIDAGQYFKKIGEHRFLYKENRICAVTAETFVYESEMDLSDYDEDEVESKVSAYYGSLSELKKTCGADWEQIALECIFEQELSEREEGFYEGPKSEIFGLKDAVNEVNKMSEKSQGLKL